MIDTCSVTGCNGAIRYRAAALCQKHYFRMWRNGTLELKVDAKLRTLGYTVNPRIVMPGRGYVRVHAPEHPLRDGNGYVAEHRKVMYEKYGRDLPPCLLCGAAITWKTCHIDHIDDNPQNNAEQNLRPLCRGCNTWRNYPEQHTIRKNQAITYHGRTLTPAEWARQPGVCISRAGIVARLRRGMSVHDALFSEQKTHKAHYKARLVELVNGKAA